MSGTEPRPAGPTKRRSLREREAYANRKLYAGIFVLVSGLAALVWWSLPGNTAPHAVTTDPSDEEVGAESLAEKAGARRALERPPRPVAELAILTDKPDEVVRNTASVSEIGPRLDVRHCGGACDAVRKFLSDKDHFEIEILKTEDLLLPPRDTMDTVAPGLTPSEREAAPARKTAVVIRANGAFTPEHMP
ncbi:MAG TPA: hypothetical protein VM580_04925, partial [Labilithrix sp.]|nr:hypothetical protein [Labilithrix sp.]